MNLRNQPSSLAYLRVWFCRMYVYIPKDHPSRVKSEKIAPRAWIGNLVGYKGENGYIYRIWNPKKRKVERVRDVVFWEDDDNEAIPNPEKEGGVAEPQKKMMDFLKDKVIGVGTA